MRYFLPAIALAGLCAGCVQPPPAPPPPDMVSELAASMPVANPNCREYTTTATVNGQPQPVVGRVCRQADGTWRLATEGEAEDFPQITDLKSWPSADNPSCVDYSAVAQLGDQQRPVVGRACTLANGTVQVTQGTPEQPALTSVVLPPAPPDDPYYYPGYYAGYYDPWFWGPPFVGIGGAFVFVDRHHHHHHHGFGGHWAGHSGGGHGGGHGGGGGHH
jgi:hypothetical protein